MTFSFEYNTKHSKQRISVWLIHEQKSIDIQRTVYSTNSADYIKYNGAIVHVRGSVKTGWHGNY